MKPDYYTHTVEAAAAYERDYADGFDPREDFILDAAESDAMLSTCFRCGATPMEDQDPRGDWCGCEPFGGLRITAAYVPDGDDLPF